MLINFNKIESLSTVDYPKKAACVVFLNQCPLRCGYCYNKQTWSSVNMVDTSMIKREIASYKPFISAVAFSGGEPTAQIEPLIDICKFAKEQNLLVGIETCGYYPDNLKRLGGYVDRIFLDIKAPTNQHVVYSNITNNVQALKRINQTLKLDLPIEIRIVDIGNTKEITDSLDTKFKVTILPFVKPK